MHQNRRRAIRLEALEKRQLLAAIVEGGVETDSDFFHEPSGFTLDLVRMTGHLAHLMDAELAARAGAPLEEILDAYDRAIEVCHEHGYTRDEAVTLPKPQTSGNKAKGRFVKADFRYVTDEDVYVCPAQCNKQPNSLSSGGAIRMV